MEKKPSMEMGVQPLDGILTELGLPNSELVAVSSEQLTHKMVAKARKGRRVTLNVQKKILNAFNTCCAPESFKLQDLFDYTA